ncbi:ZIP family metal transporter [Candidatus Altiarchaeota archaeon]
MAVLPMILLSVLAISLLSFVGILSISIGKRRLQGFLLLFVAFASGSLLAAAFIHLLPEAYGEIGNASFTFVLAGIIMFFIFEKFIHWHHCGKEECHVRPAAYLNLVADAFHNLIDGIIISAAYLLDVQVGLVTTLAIALHEIPQEFGDFSVLIHSGMSTRKALAYNFLSAVTSVIGALIGYLFLSRIEAFIPYALAMACGGFIYIATADLMPELHKEYDMKKMIAQCVALVLGVLLLMISFSAISHVHEGGDRGHDTDDLGSHGADEHGEAVLQAPAESLRILTFIS